MKSGVNRMHCLSLLHGECVRVYVCACVCLCHTGINVIYCLILHISCYLLLLDVCLLYYLLLLFSVNNVIMINFIMCISFNF